MTRDELQPVRGAVTQALEHGGIISFKETLINYGFGGHGAFGDFAMAWAPTGMSTVPKDRLVPVWKATPNEKRNSKGIRSVHRGRGQYTNYYVVNGAAEQRIRSVRIAPRPTMKPAMDKELGKWRDAVALARSQGAPIAA